VQNTHNASSPGLPSGGAPDGGLEDTADEPDTTYPRADEEGSTWELYQDEGTFPAWL
jgi:hypothetical protein